MGVVVAGPHLNYGVVVPRASPLLKFLEITTANNTSYQKLLWLDYHLLDWQIISTGEIGWAHILFKSAAKFCKLAEERQFTETFIFEAYHRSEKLKPTRKIEYDFPNQHLQATQTVFTFPTLKIVLTSVISEAASILYDFLCKPSSQG